MHRGPVFPCLPGFNFDRNLGRRNFHKSQLFDRIHDDVYFLSDKSTGKSETRYPSIYPRGESQELPAWIAYDGQRLTFKAFFQETVQERWKSAYQIRIVNIIFFPEDGTIKIIEPAVDNSGLEQGVLLRRQRVPLPKTLQRNFYDIIDLNVGKEPEIYGRVYKIVDCDKFTRNFLHRMGIPVPDPIHIPEDPYSQTRKNESFPKKPNRRKDTLGNFLKYDNQALRFYGYWDDSESPHGYIHDLEIHYFLADNTIEVKEIFGENAGRDTGSMFLRKMKVPKFAGGLEPIGSNDPYTVLNVLGEDTAHGYSMLDSLVSTKDNDNCYKEHELGIGAQLNIFGRKVVIVDMDNFTKNYYSSKYGLNDFTPLSRPGKSTEENGKGEKYIPPYNGFGSYEDSLGNCFSVMPKAPQMDFNKFLYYDKEGFDSRVLRFTAKLISDVPDNDSRHFIVRFYLMDDTISVFELAKRNSGFQRCLFQKRMRTMVPGQEIFSNKAPKFYEADALYIGARLNLNSFHFQLTSADIYTLRYMELHSDKFPKANVKLIMDKLREALKPCYSDFVRNYSPLVDKDQTLEYKHLREGLCKYLGDKITEHEIISLARRYSSHEKKDYRTREYVRRLLHAELHRSLWNELDRLKEDLEHWDRSRNGYLPRNTIYTILRGCRIPVDVELLNSMLNHLKTNEEGQVSWKDLLAFMDVQIDPTTPLPPLNVKTALWWASEKEPDCGAGIDFCRFIRDIDPHEQQGNSGKETTPTNEDTRAN